MGNSSLLEADSLVRMTMSINEILGQDGIDKIKSILDCQDWSFNALLSVSCLIPSMDFRFGDFRSLDLRGADLRGIDFTGSDLRGCLIDSKTIIDETTILIQTEIDWINEEKQPIHEAMLRIENASSSKNRRTALTTLVSQYTSPVHTHKYLKSLLDRTKVMDAFFDVADFFEPLSHEDNHIISDGVIRFALSSVKRNIHKSAQPLSTSSFSTFLRRLSESNNVTLLSGYARYLDESNLVGRVSINPNKYEVSDDLKRLVSVFKEYNREQASF